MKRKNVVISILSEDVFTDVLDKFEEIGAVIIEKSYDLLYHRYEIYARANLRQCYKIRNFIKSRDVSYIELS